MRPRHAARIRRGILAARLLMSYARRFYSSDALTMRAYDSTIRKAFARTLSAHPPEPRRRP